MKDFIFILKSPIAKVYHLFILHSNRSNIADDNDEYNISLAF